MVREMQAKYEADLKEYEDRGELPTPMRNAESIEDMDSVIDHGSLND